MKKLFLAAILFAASTLSAKPLEGTVKYRMGGQGGKGAAIMDHKAKKMTMLMPDQKKFMVHKLDGQAGQGQGR